MGTTREYIQFVLEQLGEIDGVTYKKMFGEYLVYAQGKPVLLVCDNCVMVKKLPELADALRDAPVGFPYEGAKVHYIVDIENRELVRAVIDILVRVTPAPKRKSKQQRE